MKRKIDGARILVTGASSGIGRAIAARAAERGARVVAVARSGDVLDQLVAAWQRDGSTCVAVRGDVTDDKDRRRALDQAISRFGGLDILVNNAGILATGHFADARPDRLRRILEVNFFAAAELMRLAVPVLRRGQRPMIVNIASIAGRRAVPARPEYSASKFALVGLSESIRAELAKDGIDVLVVNPSFVNTALERNMIESRARHEWQHRKHLEPDRVADRVLAAIERGQHEITIGAAGKGLLLFNRFAPRLLNRIMAHFVRKLYRARSEHTGEAAGEPEPSRRRAV